MDYFLDNNDDSLPLNEKSGFVVDDENESQLDVSTTKHQSNNTYTGGGGSASASASSTGGGSNNSGGHRLIDIDVDKLLSQKLNDLSIEERQQALHELHGVTDEHTKLKETPALIQSKLLEMNNHIASMAVQASTSSRGGGGGGFGTGGDDASSMSSLATSSTSSLMSSGSKYGAYQMALQQNLGYVQHIKLLCLRATNYDTSKACRRLLDFFACKLELFGESKLTKQITIEDLKSTNQQKLDDVDVDFGNDDDDEEEEEYDAMIGLRNGAFLLLQQRDTAGRAIIMFVGNVACECSAEACWKVLYYIVMSALQDTAIQKNGAVMILYALRQSKFHSDRPSKLARMFSYMPIRIASLHMCHDKKLMEVAKKMFCHRIESKLLCRFRSHHGSYTEVLYELMTFGIPRHVLPINDSNGELVLDAHHRWLQMQQRKEECEKETKLAATAAAAAATASRRSRKRNVPYGVGSGGGGGSVGDYLNNSMDPTNRIVTPPNFNSISCDEDSGYGSSSNNYTNNAIGGGGNDQVEGEEVEVAVVPGPLDILVGRGTLSRSSPGYIRMKNLVTEYHEEYNVADRNSKTRISRTILQNLHHHGCRFVRWTDQGLVICDETESREKVAHAFRNLRRTIATAASKKNKSKNSRDGEGGGDGDGDGDGGCNNNNNNKKKKKSSKKKE